MRPWTPRACITKQSSADWRELMASAPFIGEIRMFGGSFAPLGWTMCNGQTLSIAQNDALFTLIGTTYGGDGITTFNLPDLRSRVPIHQGQALGLSPYVIGQVGGTESVTLTTAQMPQHNHAVMAAAIGNTDNPVNGFPASDPGGNM